MTKELKKQIKDDYLFSFLSNTALANKYGLDRTTIQRCLKSEGVKLRKKTPKTKVNHFFFSEYNEISCYWAGFILADGYIRNKKRFTLEIKLQKKDVSQLEKFKMDINFNGKIIEKDNYFSISISSSQLINDLEVNFEICNKKSLICYISNKIPNENLKDYIRGYFDGDGCITFTTTDEITFVGTQKTVSFIRDYFFEKCNIKLRSKNKPKIGKVNNVFIICYSGISAYKCLNHLYENSLKYLNRKYLLYIKLKEKYKKK